MVAISRRDALKLFGLGTIGSAIGMNLSAVAAGSKSVDASTTDSAKWPVPYELPELPYETGALEPVLAKKILEVHHGRHHAGYVRGLNKTLEKLYLARHEKDFSRIKSLSRALAFHGSGHVLHTLYWNSMKPGQAKSPKGKLAEMIVNDFGSLAAFKAQFAAATTKVEGSGWGILAYEPLGKQLLVLQAERHQDLTIWGCTPLLVCDVWEHAYYLQYKNRRAEYVQNFMKIINWSFAEKRLGTCV